MTRGAKGAHLARLVAAVGSLCLVLWACPGKDGRESSPAARTPLTSVNKAPMTTRNRAFNAYRIARLEMVTRQLEGRDITDSKILEAMRIVPRHAFVPSSWTSKAYDDHPLPIGQGQTISQPYIVGLMLQLAGVKPGSRVLDVGTGSAYQMAVLLELKARTYGIEILCDLADSGRSKLHSLGYKAVDIVCGDGYRGRKEHAPYDAILVAAAPREIPQPLIEQLAPGGKLVIPVGDVNQTLYVISRRHNGSIEHKKIVPVRFVPMTGEAKAVP
jgi:protein-L-isoaspartate(D-aspartate) O-methyltransferase